MERLQSQDLVHKEDRSPWLLVRSLSLPVESGGNEPPQTLTPCLSQEPKEEDLHKLQDSKLEKIEAEEGHVVLVGRTATYAYHVNAGGHSTRSVCCAWQMDMARSMLLATIILMVFLHTPSTAIGAHPKQGVPITQAD